MSQNHAQDIPLAAMIESLRNEMQTAMAEGHGKPVRLQVKDIDVEVAVEIEKSTDAKGGIKFWVLNAGSSHTSSSSSRHVIKLRLQPTDESGGPLNVGAVRPEPR